METRFRVEEERLAVMVGASDSQLALQNAQVGRLNAVARFQRGRVHSMKVLAGAHGILQELPLEVGQWAQSGATLARLVEPGKLKAVLRIPETQAKDISIGQPAKIDTRNGIVRGKVRRIDPAVQNGTVTVDVSLEGEMPRGARPDLSVAPRRAARGAARLRPGQQRGGPLQAYARRLGGDPGDRPPRPYLGEHGRDRRRAVAGRQGHHFRHVALGRLRPGESGLSCGPCAAARSALKLTDVTTRRTL